VGNGRAGSEESGDADGASSQRERDADDRDTVADRRESELRARETRAEAREALDVDLREGVQGILDAAEKRDDDADARDVAASERDSAASLHSFLHDDEYDASLKARRSAAMDRADSHTDRDSAADDRSKLTERAGAEPEDEAH
jgi:hypothetical protein